MQEASVLKPSALSLLLLPSADKLFSCQWAIFHYFSFTEKKSSCQCMPNACQLRKKLSVLTRVLLVRQWNLNSFLENLYFSISLTSEILVSNTKWQPSPAGFFWVWQVFFLSVHEYSLLFGKPDKHFACQLIFLWLVDKQKACQCSFSTPLTSKKLVTGFFFILTSVFLVSAWFLISLWLVDKQKACQCSF